MCTSEGQLRWGSQETVREARLKLFGHVERKGGGYTGQRWSCQAVGKDHRGHSEGGHAEGWCDRGG